MARRTARTPVRIATAGAAVLAAGLLAACSASSSGGAAPTSSVPPSTTTSTVTATAPATSAQTTSAPATSTSTVTASTSAAGTSGGSGGSGSGTSAYCKESQLRAYVEAKPVAGSGEHGRKAVIVDFLNTSGSTCVLYGYPGAAVLDASGTQVKEAKRTVRGALLGYAPGHDTLVRVRLKPGHVAKAGIEGTDQQEQGAAQAGCDDAPDPRIEVTPPNTRTAVPFTVTWPICYSFTVHPVNYS